MKRYEGAGPIVVVIMKSLFWTQKTFHKLLMVRLTRGLKTTNELYLSYVIVWAKEDDRDQRLLFGVQPACGC